MILCPQYQDLWKECEDTVTERLHKFLLRRAINEDTNIRKRINNVSESRLRLILFPYYDPAFRDAQDLTRLELTRGLTPKVRLLNLTKLTTKKIGKLLALKFLELFFTEFHNHVWARRCELMIQLEQEHGITIQQKTKRQNGSDSRQNVSVVKTKEDMKA